MEYFNRFFIIGKPADPKDIQHPDWVPSCFENKIHESLKFKLKRYENVKRRSALKDISNQNIPATNRIIYGFKNEFIRVAYSEINNDPSEKVSYMQKNKSKAKYDVFKEHSYSISLNQQSRVEFCNNEQPEQEQNLNCVQCQKLNCSLETSHQILGAKIIENENLRRKLLNISRPCENCCDLQNTINELKSKLGSNNKIIEKLKIELNKKSMDICSLNKSDDNTIYLTGVSSYSVLLKLYNFIEDELVESSQSILSKEQMFMMTLKRIRLNYQLHSIAIDYQISEKSASTYYHSTLNVLYRKLKNLVYWPDRMTLQKHTPISFQKIYKTEVTVIIDCFEINMQRPSTMSGQCNVYSSYKAHNTVKVLIGISTYGSIIFISKPYGGRCSDKYITEHCGFLNYIQENDLIFADRGFLIEGAVKERKSRINIPTFKKSRNQITATELHKSLQLSSFRIHVERLIGSVKQKYQILHNNLPISTISKYHNGVNVLEQILFVSAALVNLCPEIIKT